MPAKKIGMKERAALGAAATTVGRAATTERGGGIKDRHQLGGDERVRTAARRHRGRTGRPPIWPTGTPVERLHLKLPAPIVKALRLMVVEQRRDISRIAAEPLAEFTGVRLADLFVR